MMTFTTINGTVIHYEYLDNKKDRTFVFINSLGTDFRIWDGVVDILKDNANILRYDKNGHGLSEERKTTENILLQIKDYAHEVLDLIDKLGIKKVVIVGLSIGGIVGQYLAIHHAERIEKLVLSNTAPKVGNDDIWNTRIKVLQTDGVASISDTIMKVWFSANFHQHRSEELAGYKMMLTNSNQIGYIQACEALKANDLTNEIHQIKTPTLCIAGTEDGSTPPMQVKAMADQIPHAKYILIEGVGHIPCVEVPELVAEYILDFVR